MSTEQNASALSEFLDSTVPLSQVRENMNPANGTYNVAVLKLDAKLDDEGRVYVQGEFNIHAKDTPGTQPQQYQQRFFIGTDKDPLAKLPETRLNSRGFGELKGFARVCDQPTNDQPVKALIANLIGKQFTHRIEERTYKDKQGNQKTAVGFGRTPVKLGSIPARLDGAPGGAAINGAAGAPTVAPSATVAGATFGNE